MVIKNIISSDKFRYVFNSSLSVVSRFILVFLFINLLKFNFLIIHTLVYFYVLLQSYLVSKFFVFHAKETNYLKFIFFNLIITLIEYFLILNIVKNFNVNYSLATLVTGLFTFLFRYLVYRYIIFKK